MTTRPFDGARQLTTPHIELDLMTEETAVTMKRPELACTVERSEITLTLRRFALTQRTAPAKGAPHSLSGNRVPTARSAYRPAALLDGAGSPALVSFVGVSSYATGRATSAVARPGELSIWGQSNPSLPRRSKAIQGDCPADKPDYLTTRNA